MRLTFAVLLLISATPVIGQTQTVEGRVGKLEKEMRAVQRKVFPEGSQQFLEPEIRPAAPATAPAGSPASGVIVDLTARVDALEGQLRQLTGQVEQDGYRLKQLEDQVARLRAERDASAAAPEAARPADIGVSPAPPPADYAPPPPRARPVEPRPAPEAAAPPPSSGDPAEDAYMAGYRLWAAKRYPEAQAALKEAARRYPKHRRYSYAQNLLGRAYLDDGKPALAAEALYANYRAAPRGERAPDSLYYLGQALVRLKKTAEACRVYDELRDVYGEKIEVGLRAKVTQGRADARCPA